MSDSPQQSGDEFEPTIVPVRRPLAAEPSGAMESEAASRSRPLLTGIAVIVALVAVGGVFFYLPGWVERQRVEPEPEPDAVVVEPAVAEPELSAEELARLRARAETLLAEQLEQQQDLEVLSAASWGDTTWSSYINAARQATDAFADEDLPLAVRLYEEAIGIGETLQQRSRSIVNEALAAGAQAIDSGNAELAASQFELVLEIEPGNAQALRGQARAATLGDVLAAMRRGDEADARGQLNEAAAAYREALALDTDWQAARTALDAVNVRLAAARFDNLLDEAFAAVTAGSHERAIELFTEALAVRPDSAAARDGLAQAEQGQLLDAIRMAEIRGSAFERTERWDQAIARYREALAADSSLRFAIEGLERAQRRADLDAKLQVLIDSPRRLLAEDVLADGRRVLDEARAIEEPGARHLAQIEQLAMLIELASTPIPVQIESDGLTEVIVYRVGELGAFTHKEVELKPGSYTAVGQRRGYRDVRESFTVLPGAERTPIRVVCTEPI